MKRSLHKILAIILTLVLVIGQTPAPTLAVTSESFSLNGDIVADAVAGSASQLDFDPYSDYVENEIVLTDADTNEAFPEGHQFSAGDRLRFKVRFELNSSDAWYGNFWRPTDCDYMIREAYRQGNTGYGFNATPTTLPQIDENTVFTIPFEGLQYLSQASSLPWSQSEKQAGYIDGSMNVAFYWWLDRSTNQLCLTFTEDALMGSRGYETLNNMYINVTSTLDMGALAGAGSAEFKVANVPFELPLAASYSAGKKAQMVFNKATGNYDINYTVTVNVDRDVDLSSVDLNILDTRKTGTIIGEPTNVQVTTNSGDDVSVSATKVDDLNTRFDLSSGDNILKKGQYTITYTAPVTQSYDSLFGNGGNGYNALTHDQRQNEVTVRNGDTPTDAKATAQLSWVPAAEETRFGKGTLYDYANQPSYNNIYKETVNGQECYFVDYYVEAKIKNDAGSLVITDDAGQWMTHVNETPEVLYISKGLDEWFNADDMTAASGASVSYTDNGSVRTYTITGDPLAAGAYRIKYRLQVKPEAVAQALASGSALELKNSAAMTTLDEQPVSNRTAQSTNNIPASETPSKTYEVITAEDGTKLIKWTLRFRWNFFQDDQSRIVDTLSSGEYYIAEGYPFTINNNYNDRASITDPANAANIGVIFNADNTSFTYVLGTCGHADERTDSPYVITYYTRVEANEDGSYPEHSNTYDVTYSSGGATGTTTGTVTAPLTGTEPEEPDPEDPDTPETAIEVAPGKDHISSTYDKATQRVISKWEVTVDLSNLPMERMTSFSITDLIPDNLKNNMAITGVDVVARAEDWNTTTPLTKDTHYTVTETSDDEWTVNLQLASALEAIGTSRWITATFTTSSTLIDPNQEYQNYQNNARLDYAYGDFTVSKTDDAWGSCQLLKSKKEASVYSDFYDPATGEYGFGPDGVNDLIWQLVLKDAAFKNRGTPTTVTISDTMPTTDSGIPIMQLMEGSLRIRSTGVSDGNVPVYITNYTLNNSGTGFTLTFDVPADWASDTVYVFYCCEMTSEYMATVQGDTYLNNVTNTATAGWDGASEQLQATTGLNVTDKRLTKTGAVSSDRSKVTYTIRINEHGLDLDSTGDTVLLTDRMNSTSVSYAQASFVLKDSAGNTLTRSGTASATTYHLKFSDDGKSFELEIPDETSLVLTYIAEPTTQVGSETGNIGNEAKLGTVTRYSNVNSFKVDLPSAGASTALSKGECGVLIYKNDGETDMPLDGAVFTVYSVNPDLTETATSKSATTVGGRALFRFKSDEEGFGFDQVYCIRETTAPEGYQKTDTAWYFYFIALDENGDQVEPNEAVKATVAALEAAGVTVNVDPTVEMYTYTAVNTAITVQTGSFSFTKVDQNGAALDGAAFTLVDNLTQQTVEAVSGSAAGVFAYENLLPGTYTLTEVAAPAGYTKPENASWTVTVAEDGTVTVTGEGYDAAKNTITNTQITGSFTFTKVDQNGAALDGAAFTLVDNLTQQTVEAVSGSAAGVFAYENLLPGTYTLTEVAAPAGYAKPEN
ncbi:MAG: hypothetical protein IJ041_08720, partial [Clostridia bacterium]|nr:hypothetical protein [Clostridia bacterium]